MMLEDGIIYDLGATFARYNKSDDCFMGGNWFVHRSKTMYKNWGVK